MQQIKQGTHKRTLGFGSTNAISIRILYANLSLFKAIIYKYVYIYLPTYIMHIYVQPKGLGGFGVYKQLKDIQRE